MTTVRVKASRARVKALLSRLPSALAGPEGKAVRLRVGMVALALIKEAFVVKARGGTDEAGLSWAPLKPATVKGRRKGGAVGTPEALRDTGVLLNSLSPGAPGNVLEATAGVVTVGSNVPYAKFQHEGTRTIVARPLWPDPADWPARWWGLINQEALAGTQAVIERMLRGLK